MTERDYLQEDHLQNQGPEWLSQGPSPAAPEVSGETPLGDAKGFLGDSTSDPAAGLSRLAQPAFSASIRDGDGHARKCLRGAARRPAGMLPRRRLQGRLASLLL